MAEMLVREYDPADVTKKTVCPRCKREVKRQQWFVEILCEDADDHMVCRKIHFDCLMEHGF
jgi:hypothetical protein